LSRIRHKRQPRAREPPNAQTSVHAPFFGHLIGLARGRVRYLAEIGYKQREPMTKVSVMGTNIYITGSSKMIPSMQRQPRTISPKSFFAKFICPLIGCSKRATARFNDGLSALSDVDSMLHEGSRITKRILSSATGTDMNYGASKIVNKHFQAMDMSIGRKDVDLVKWTKSGVLHIISEGTYGPDNPFWIPENEAALWDFSEHTLGISTTSFLPKFMRPWFVGGIESREKMVKAMDAYLHGDGLAQGSPIVIAHHEVYKENIEDNVDIARFECGTAIGTFANTTPTSIWSVFHIFSNEGLLQRLRAELSTITTSVKADDGRTIHRIDSRQLKSATVLLSTIQEVSRYRVTGVGVRYVTADTIVGDDNDSYALKKNSWMIISNKSLHRDKEAWGEDADEFVADRFTRKVPHAFYRTFGNGHSACCGKNFALHHIASFLALLVMRFDIQPEGGVWKEPRMDTRDSTTQLTAPIDIPATMIPRINPQEEVWELSE